MNVRQFHGQGVVTELGCVAPCVVLYSSFKKADNVMFGLLIRIPYLFMRAAFLPSMILLKLLAAGIK
jgi:hypothetical protein